MVNLYAHPLAGFAAAGAIGLGLMSQAFGMWAGAFAGVADASQRLASAGRAGPAAPSKAAVPLKLVVSRSAPVVKAATAESVRPTAIDKPASPDDLKAIAGIGPKLEKVLNGLGIWTYGQIAVLKQDEIAWLDDHLGFAGRIGRDDWIGQAKALLASAG